MTRQADAGFTLIEALVAMAVPGREGTRLNSSQHA